MSVSTEITTYLHRGQCRCCGTVTKCKIITQEYEFLGKKEIFINMLRNCFGINLSHLNGQLGDKLVCTACVSKMRSALTFKRMVQQTEEKFFQDKYSERLSDAISVPEEYPLEMVKTELREIDDLKHLDLENMPDGLDDELTPELLWEYEQWSVGLKINDSKPTEVNDITTQHGNMRKICGNINNIDEEKEITKNTELEEQNYYSSSDDEYLSNIKGTNNQHNEIGQRTSKNKDRDTLTSAAKDTNVMLGANLTAILKYSYVCPFKSRFNHIICFYCLKDFLDPQSLREHTLTHDPSTFKFETWHKNTKIDIARVDCRLCETKIEDLESFKSHIVTVHKKVFYPQSRDCVVPFKLETDVNRCAICCELFASFHELSQHMNLHFSNFICETCGMGFMSEVSHYRHTMEHTNKQMCCRICGRTFKTRYSRMLHIRRVHKKTAGATCKKCDKFVLLNDKKRHMLEEHGESPAVACIACDKVFNSRRLLTSHIRKAHMKNAGFECQTCSRRFSTRHALKLHMPTHTGERNFKCEVCNKTYPRQKTLRQHMKIHNNDRRFKCTICGQAFVQNCSLKGHMKNKHSEYEDNNLPKKV